MKKYSMSFFLILFFSFTLAQSNFQTTCSPTVFQISPQADNHFTCYLQNNSDNNLSISLELIPNYLTDYISNAGIPSMLPAKHIQEVNFTIQKAIIKDDIQGFVKFSAKDENDTNTTSNKIYLLTKASYDSFFNNPDNAIPVVEKPIFTDQLTWLGNFFENSHFEINQQPVKNWMLIVAGIAIIFCLAGLIAVLKRS